MKTNKFIQANAMTDIHMVEANAAPVEFIEAAADGDDGDDPIKLKRFSINAYTGGPMQVGFGLPVVVDLAGMKVSSKARPILKDHNPAQVVGHTDSIKVAKGSLKATGVVSGANGFADEVVASSAQGFPWQASIGAQIDRMVEVAKGETAEANGRTFKGPVLIARKSTLKEISFVALGADDNTDARVAAKNTTPQTPEILPMGFDEWIKAQGLELDKLSAEQVDKLKATYEQINALQASADAGDQDVDDAPDVKAMLDDYKAGVARVSAVQKIAADHPTILAKALDNDWDETRTELEVLRASRPAAPNVNTGAGRAEGLTNEVVEAAICMAGNLGNIDSHFDEKTLDAAQKRYKGRIGLQEVLVEAANANGYAGSPSFRRDARGILQAAFSQNIHAAGGFSTLSITDILSNTANKFLLQGYNAIESTWRAISSIRSVSDFKQVTSYNLIGDLEYEEVGAAGAIKHGTLSDESFTNQAKTYAKMLAVTRQDQINDDLGALTAAPTKLGRGAALKANKVFWTEFLDNTSFFAAGNNNLATSNSLSIGGLTNAELKFLDQKTPENADGATGSPLGISPAILLVPNALNVTASQLMNTTSVDVSTTSDTPLPNSNPHAGKFSVVRSSYLNDSTLGGAYSATTWYLLANPMDLPTIEVAALNGNPEPTVETADADFSTLGIQMRGYADFGVSKQNPLAGVKSTA